MKLPKKIYITPNIDRKWQTEAIDNESVEYTRTDAFMEKSCEWLKNYLEITEKELLIDDFKTYMEGE